jgi:hypothetical protein
MRKIGTDQSGSMWAGSAGELASACEGMWLAALALLAWLLVSAGCASQLKQSGELTSPAHAGVAVTVISTNAQWQPTSEPTGRALVACVTDAIREKLPDLLIVPAENFGRAAFPQVPLEAAPLSPESLAVLLEDSVFLAGAGQSRVRFLITVAGRTTQPSPEVGVVATYGGLGGFWVWKRESSVTAAIYDLGTRSPAGNVQVEVRGRPWFAIIGVFPLGAPSFTESWACQKLGNAIVEFLRGRREARP